MARHLTRFPRNDIISLTESAPRFDLAESVGPDLRLRDLLGDGDLADMALSYGTAAGSRDLRKAVADLHDVAADDVVITNGGMHALFLTAMILCEPGDEAVTTSPLFPNTDAALRSVGAMVKTVPLLFDNSYRLDLDGLRAQLTSKTRLVSIASPQNPSGVVTPRQTIREITALMADICPDAFLIVDETYREAVYGDNAIAPSAMSLGPNIVSCASLSKCHGVPGLRIGWAITRDAALRDQLVLGKFNTVISCSPLDEALALRVLNQRDRIIGERRGHLAEGLARVEDWVESNSAYAEWVRPYAGALCCVRLRPAVFDAPAVDRFYTVIEREGVRVASGTWFGDEPRVFRLGFGLLDMSDLQTALGKLSAALRNALDDTRGCGTERVLIMTEMELLEEADRRARIYVSGARNRDVFPGDEALAGLSRFNEAMPIAGQPPAETLKLLDEAGSPATVASNGPNYYGFVIGATLPVAAAAERMAIAWDQCAASFINSPTAATIEKTAARWVLDVLGLPAESAVSFGTSASACGLACLTAARRTLLERQGWNFDEDGLIGAPEIRVVVSETVHVTIKKALRMMGFGLGRVIYAPVDACGRIDPERLPDLDGTTILCLQAGEVNTGEFDPFVPLIAKAKAAGAWVHVDGAFGLWARVSAATRHLTEGIEGADSWTCDGHKWLNTPYDGAMGICRDAGAMAAAMNSDAVYFTASADSQKNIGLEFSRRARGIPIWAALRTLGRDGIAEMVERHCRQARQMAEGLKDAGFEILNRVVLNQVLVRLDTDAKTDALREAAVATGKIWFGPTVWQGRRAFRISVSSWRTTDEDIEAAIALLAELKRAI